MDGQDFKFSIKQFSSFAFLTLAVFLVFCGVYEGYLVGWNLALLLLIIFLLGVFASLLLVNARTIVIQSLSALCVAFALVHLFYSIPEFVYPGCPRSLDRCGQLVGFSVVPYILGVALSLLARFAFMKMRNWRKRN